jgi:hypothetical protein
MRIAAYLVYEFGLILMCRSGVKLGPESVPIWPGVSLRFVVEIRLYRMRICKLCRAYYRNQAYSNDDVRI